MSVFSGRQARKASANAERARLTQQQRAIDFLRENRQDLAQAVQEGRVDLNTAFDEAISQLDPLTDLTAFNQALEILQLGPGELTPQLQREFERGEQAIQGAFSRVSGGGVSSRALEVASQFGQDFAARRLNEELARLAPFINLSTGARENVAELETLRGRSLANLGIRGAESRASLGRDIATGITNLGTIRAEGITERSNVKQAVTADLINRGIGLATGGLSSGVQQLTGLFTGGRAPADLSLARGLPNF